MKKILIICSILFQFSLSAQYPSGIAWEYRNSYTEKTFDKTKFK